MRSIVITGVSRGLGAALFAQAQQYADRVVGIGRRFTDRQRRLAAEAPERVRLCPADLAEPSSLPDAAVLAALLDGCTDAVLLHNAAVVAPVGVVGGLAPAQVTAAVLVNLVAPMTLTNAFLAAVGPAAHRVQVLFVSSGAAYNTTEGTAVYSATKRGAEKFFEVLAAEVAQRDPRVTVASVNPGIMDTDMQTALRTAEFPHRGRMIERLRRGELQDPAAVARKILAQYVTAQ